MIVPTPQQIAMAECHAVAIALRAIGGVGTVEEVAAKLGVPVLTTLRRLRSGSAAADKDTRPEWCYFAVADGQWGLTLAGSELARTVPKKGIHVFANAKDETNTAMNRKIRVTVTCPMCRQSRDVSRTSLAGRRKAGLVVPCVHCAKKLRKDCREMVLPDLTSDPRQPTQAPPGSPMKMAILVERFSLYERGEWRGPICIPGDKGTMAGASGRSARVEAEDHADERGMTTEVEVEELEEAA